MLLATKSIDPWQAFLQEGLLGTQRLVANADVEIESLGGGDDERLPVVINRSGRADCSWVTSLRNTYGPYARAETDLVDIRGLVRPLSIVASHAAEALLVACGLSGGIFLNNWLLATNLYTEEFGAERIQSCVEELIKREKHSPIIIRSLTPFFHAKLLRELSENGFLLLPSRQIWILPEPAKKEWRTHRDSRRDLKLVAASAQEWEWLPAAAFSDRDFSRALHLYQSLYRKRYPQYNPDYTENFLKTGVATEFLKLVGLRRVGSKELSGIVGMVHRGAVSCTPVLGYDLNESPAVGLYRRLTLRAFLEAESRETTLHCSAGAGAFKFSRGAKPHVEFAAIWANHLPAYQRAGLRALSAALRKWLVPYIESHRF